MFTWRRASPLGKASPTKRVGFHLAFTWEKPALRGGLVIVRILAPTFKMANKQNQLFMISLQISMFLLLIFQQYYFLIIWKINEINRNAQLFYFLQRKRRYVLQKLKIARRRRLARRIGKRRCWVTSGRTDQWW